MLTLELLQGNFLRILPFIPENLEVCFSVRKLLENSKTDALAIPLPFFVKSAWELAIKALPRISCISIKYTSGEVEYIVVSPLCPLVEATRWALAHRIPLFFVDLPLSLRKYSEELPPTLHPYLIGKLGFEKFFNLVLSFTTPESSTKRIGFIGESLLKLTQKFSHVTVLLTPSLVAPILSYVKNPRGILYLPERQVKEVEVFALGEKTLRELLLEPGYFHEQYEKNKENWLSSKKFPDRAELWEDVLKRAVEVFEKKTGTFLAPKDFKVFAKFLRNYSLLQGKFFPDLMDIVVAARGIGGDEFAFWMWEVATTYGLNNSNLSLPTKELSLEELNLPFKKLRLFRKIKSLRRRLRFLKKFSTREDRKKFAESFSGKVICSFPPEDIVVETFGKKVIEKGLKVVTENLRRIEPFSSSIKDGIDIRETIRKWFFEEVPYVIEEPLSRAKAGSVVVIFEEDPDPLTGIEKYPWKFTWHGEHHQESDMAFYSTDPSEDVIGPGIARAKYGGFMLTYPPMRVYDIWADPYFDIAQNKAERLLLAGIDYSLEKYIIYIAHKPPSRIAKEFARVQGKKIIFLPIGSFSRNILEKIRTFHVLEGHHVRSYAHRFIDK